MLSIYRNKTLPRAMTLVEIVLALSILVVVFVAIVPQIRCVQTSWASKRANADVIQNGRVLMDHLTRYLQQAVRIIAVSSPANSDGYIEFEDNDGDVVRYDISADNYVEFGAAGNLADVAEPVSTFRFTCYDAYDFSAPTHAYLRTNANVKMEITKSSAFRFDNTQCEYPDLVQISQSYYLCA